MSLLVDLRPLREHPPFRRLWIGGSVSMIGGRFGSFAATYAVWELSHSTVLVGALGLASAAAWLVVALVGGAFIDSVDRVRLIRWVTVGQISTALGLALAAHLGSVVMLIVLVAVHSALHALGGPARLALVSNLVPAERLTAALALNSLSHQVAVLLGPALAGLLTAGSSVAVCFLADAATFVISLIGLRGLRARSAQGRAETRGWAAVREGVVFAVRRPVVRGALLSDLAAVVLAMPTALFPAINQERFGGDPFTLGLFSTAGAVGGLIGAVLSGIVTRRRSPGLVMTLGGATWGVGLAVAGVAPTLPLLLGGLALAGLADTWSVVSRGTLVQGNTPDHLRGRVSALEQLVGVAGPDLGNFRAGAVAPLIGAGPAMVVGGLTCVGACGLIYLFVPQMRRWAPPSAPERGVVGQSVVGQDRVRHDDPPLEPMSKP